MPALPSPIDSAARGCPVAGPSRRPLWQQTLELLLVCAALGLLSLLALRAFTGVAATNTWWLLPFALLLGALGADFSSGCVHWFGDTFFREESPIIGPLLIAPFREHHRDPEGILRHGQLELHGNSAVPVVAALSAMLSVLPDASPEDASPWTVGLETWLFFYALSALATNQLHVWAHRPRPPRLVRALQRRRLILDPADHRRHHGGAFRQSYCITTGWLNPWLDRIGFFPDLERRIRAAIRRLGW